MLRFTNLTQANEIGANSYLLHLAPDSAVLLDAGMHPKNEGYDALPLLDLVHSTPLRSIFISHAHHDHTGTLPLYQRQHTSVPVFMTEATACLTETLLHNSVEVMSKQRTTVHPEYPLYTHKEITRISKRWQLCSLGRHYDLQGDPATPKETCTFRFHDAGHILGSTAIEFTVQNKKVLYTGDINLSSQTLMFPARLPHIRWDLLIIEATRGENTSAPTIHREQIINHFITRIREVFERDGSILIPCFALGKTQETLTLLYHAQLQGQLPPTPIYIGGLSKAFTEIYDRLAHRSPRAHPDLHIQRQIQPRLLDGRTAHNFRPAPRTIYLLSSGMMTPKTLSNFLAPHFLNDPRHAIFFIGYCDPESPAGRLLHSVNTSTASPPSISLDEEEEPLPVHCSVEHFDLTAHAQGYDLLQYILQTNPRHCILVHGDPAALQNLKQSIHTSAPHINVIIPPPRESIEIDLD
ncbi:MAG: MBL fold metallo-hydrolase [Methylacidiphilales bacterium]|nr:MBL fold metallo-hydrolase [Candidatus Methylacidiphilales bacterium]MDW8349952.1 MBL fold metallo-hydrolase [Verrucomicrobiae bacterium]